MNHPGDDSMFGLEDKTSGKHDRFVFENGPVRPFEHCCDFPCGCTTELSWQTKDDGFLAKSLDECKNAEIQTCSKCFLKSEDFGGGFTQVFNQAIETYRDQGRNIKILKMKTI